HLSDSVLYSARFEAPLIMGPDRRDMRFRNGYWELSPRTPRLTAPVAFLTGGAAISYAESTMGVVEEQRLAPIVGGTTAGTNGNVNMFTVPGGYRVLYTGMRVRKRDGTPHHGVGIAPTVPVERTLQGVRE